MYQALVFVHINRTHQGLLDGVHPNTVVAREVLVASTKRVCSDKGHRLRPGHTHTVQECFLDLGALVGLGEAIRRFGARAKVPILPPPQVRRAQVEAVARRLTHHGVGCCDPEVGAGHEGVGALVEERQLARVAPQIGQAGVCLVGEVEAPVRAEVELAHGGDGAAVEVHKVMRGEAEDAPQEVRSVLGDSDCCGEIGDVRVDVVVSSVRDAQRHVLQSAVLPLLVLPRPPLDDVSHLLLSGFVLVERRKAPAAELLPASPVVGVGVVVGHIDVSAGGAEGASCEGGTDAGGEGGGDGDRGILHDLSR